MCVSTFYKSCDAQMLLTMFEWWLWNTSFADKITHKLTNTTMRRLPIYYCKWLCGAEFFYAVCIFISNTYMNVWKIDRDAFYSIRFLSLYVWISMDEKAGSLASRWWFPSVAAIYTRNYIDRIYSSSVKYRIYKYFLYTKRVTDELRRLGIEGAAVERKIYITPKWGEGVWKGQKRCVCRVGTPNEIRVGTAVVMASAFRSSFVRVWCQIMRKVRFELGA